MIATTLSIGWEESAAQGAAVTQDHGARNELVGTLPSGCFVESQIHCTPTDVDQRQGDCGQAGDMIAQGGDVVETRHADMFGHTESQLAPCGDGTYRHHVGDRENAGRPASRTLRTDFQRRGESSRRTVSAVSGEVARHFDDRAEPVSAQGVDESVPAVDRCADVARPADDRECAMPVLVEGLCQLP